MEYHHVVEAHAEKMEQFTKQNTPCRSVEERRMTTVPTPTVWILTMPFFSHLISGSELAESIAEYGLPVTLFGAKHDIQRLQTSRDQPVEKWKQRGLDVQLRSLEIQGNELATVTSRTEKFIIPCTQAVNAFEEILRKELDRKFKPTCVISDSLLAPAMEIATRFQIPAWPFVTTSVGLTVTNIYIKELESKGVLTLPNSYLDEEAQEALISFPGLPLVRICDIPDVHFKSDPLYAWGCQRGEVLKKAENIILVSFRELEPRGCCELERILETIAKANSVKVPRIWTVGPLNVYRPESEGRKSEDDRVNPSINFLNSQPKMSVVYVAFGTDVSLSPEQIRELMYGLESSQQPFLCVLHIPKESVTSGIEAQGNFSYIAPECLERIGSRGLFLEWAPQPEVLSHPSIGAFISHCGYGSLLESVCMGVPILAWPLKHDQFMNCRLLVDEIQMALEVRPGLLYGGFVDRRDVEKGIITLFQSEKGNAVRKRAIQMMQQAHESIGENGSSTKNMQALVAAIENLARLNVEESSPQM